MPLRNYAWIFVLIVHVSLGKAQEFSIKKYTTADGLPFSFVYGTYQDDIGYLWIGTEKGLSKFDGEHFTNYGVADGLPNASVDAVFNDSEQRLWVGTRRGMAELKGNHFVTYPYSDSATITYVFAFHETPTHAIWAITAQGVYTWKQGIWEKLVLLPNPDSPVRQVIDGTDGIYFEYGNQIIKQRSDGTYQEITPKQRDHLYYLQMFEWQGVVYVTTSHGVAVLRNDHLAKMAGLPGRLSGVYHFYLDSKGRCWVASEANGVRYCDPKYDDTWHIVISPQRFQYASGFSEDRDGNIWIAYSNALIRLSQRYSMEYRLPAPKSQRIGALLNYTPGNCIAANTQTDTLWLWNGNAWTPSPVSWKHKGGNKFFIENVATDPSGDIWYQNWFVGVFRESNGVLSVEYDRGKQEQAKDIIYDAFRRTAVAAIDSESTPCLFEAGAWIPMKLYENSPSCGSVTELIQCANQTLLISTRTGMIYSIDTFNRCALQLDPYHGKGSGCAFYNDLHDGVWIVKPNDGADRYSWSGHRLVFAEELDINHGLRSDAVMDMAFDSTGMLWVLTPPEIVMLAWSDVQKRYQRQYAFQTKDLSLQFVGKNKIVTDNQSVWVADDTKMVHFDVNKTSHLKLHKPGIQIEEIRLNQRKTDWKQYDDSLAGIFQLPLHLSLPYDQSSLEFRFAGIAVSGADGMQYSHQLVPLEKGWSAPSDVSTVSYIQIPSGDYTFNVRASFGNGTWSAPASFTFEICEAWWETWWFRVLVLIIAMIILWVSFQYRLRQIRNKAAVKEQLRDLEQTALRSQMNPHFIHNALNSIQSLIFTDQSQEASMYISKFAKLLRLTLESADQKRITLGQELHALRLYIDLERLRMQLDFTYEEEIDEDIPLTRVRIPPVILQPFVENALWHGLARKEGEKQLTVRIWADDQVLHCEIMDNGIGRHAASASKSPLPEGGLSKSTEITRRRLMTFNRNSDMDPISFEDLKDDSGTRVHLRMQLEQGV